MLSFSWCFSDLFNRGISFWVTPGTKCWEVGRSGVVLLGSRRPHRLQGGYVLCRRVSGSQRLPPGGGSSGGWVVGEGGEGLASLGRSARKEGWPGREDCRGHSSPSPQFLKEGGRYWHNTSLKAVGGGGGLTHLKNPFKIKTLPSDVIPNSISMHSFTLDPLNGEGNPGTSVSKSCGRLLSSAFQNSLFEPQSSLP